MNDQHDKTKATTLSRELKEIADASQLNSVMMRQLQNAARAGKYSTKIFASTTFTLDDVMKWCLEKGLAAKKIPFKAGRKRGHAPYPPDQPEHVEVSWN